MTRQARQLTVRLDPDLARALVSTARAEGASLNRAAVALMRRGAGLASAKRSSGIGDALDAVLGKWTRTEAAEFEAALSPLETIDAELWTRAPGRAARRRPAR